jgi:hypothetical protein
MFCLIFLLGHIVLVTELMARHCSTVVMTFFLLSLMNQMGLNGWRFHFADCSIIAWITELGQALSLSLIAFTLCNSVLFLLLK